MEQSEVTRLKTKMFYSLLKKQRA